MREQSVAEHDTLLVERVRIYVRFAVVGVALVHQVFLDHTSNPFSYRDSTSTQRLHTIPQNLQTGHMKCILFIISGSSEYEQ